jgi:hypothetical protein
MFDLISAKAVSAQGFSELFPACLAMDHAA